VDFDKVIEKLQEEINYAKDNFVPIIRDKSAEFLYNYVKENNIKTVLEIGTAIGFSGSLIISAGAEKLTTIEIKEKYFEKAKSTFEKLNIKDRVSMHLGDAKDVIRVLKDGGYKFDMIFLDGAKGQYINYLDTLKDLLNKNGIIFADNVLLHGMVEMEGVIPRKKRTMVMNLRKYIDAINKPPYQSELIRLEDGIAITKVKGD